MQSIKDANNDYNLGKYSDALSKYEKFITKNPELREVLKLNILLTQKRIKKNYFNNTIQKKEELILKELLARKPQKISLNFKHYLRAIDDIKRSKINVNTLINSIYCLESSPFQISILKSIYFLIDKLNLNYLLTSCEKEEFLTIRSLIKLATDHDYWITYKNIIRSKLKKDNINSLNFEKLMTTDPSGISTKSQEKIIQRKNKEITFGTICLNEQKFIGENLCSHYQMCDEWIIVEGACKGYPEKKVSKSGLSLDYTELIINLFPDPESKINYIRYGWTIADGEHAKSELRNEYITRSSGAYLVVIDADEFYLNSDLEIGINDLKKDSKKFAIVFPQVHFWKTTSNFIIGDYYDISHTRIFRNIPGMKYIKNHNFPELNDNYIHEMGQFKYQRKIVFSSNLSDAYKYEGPKCYHMGFAKDYEDMKDKTEYYINRGEDKTRPSTTSSRAAWFNNDFPEKCRVMTWGGGNSTLLDYD